MKPRPAWTVLATSVHGWSEADVSYALAVLGETAKSVVEITANRIVWRNERGEVCTHHRFAQAMPQVLHTSGPTWATGGW